MMCKVKDKLNFVDDTRAIIVFVDVMFGQSVANTAEV